MQPLDIVEDRFVPEPTHEGRTVICVDVMAQKDFDAKIAPILARLGLQQESHGLVWQGCAVTFGTANEAALFRMFYEGDTAHAR